MNHQQSHYNTKGPEKIEGRVLCYKPYPPEWRQPKLNTFQIALRLILAAVMIAAIIIIATADAEDVTLQCWVLCKPGDYINLRMAPSKKSASVGYLECGDGFRTDGESRNGFIRVLDAGDCECWIYCGYVVTEKPEAAFEQYTVVARNRVACRRWVDGPQVEARPWLLSGSEVQVFWIAGEWAVTNRGYVKTEWLEVDPV